MNIFVADGIFSNVWYFPAALTDSGLIPAVLSILAGEANNPTQAYIVSQAAVVS